VLDVTVTPLGIAIGAFPIRDMVWISDYLSCYFARLLNRAKDLAANFLLATFAI
jgi:hypothetical protein